MMVAPWRGMLPALLAASVLIVGGGTGARAETMKACSAKYQAAKAAGTLNGQDWKDFRKAQCGSATAAAAAPAATTTASAAAPAASPAATPPAATTPAPAAAPAATTASSGGSAVFPDKVNPKYASLSAGKARMKTCVDQYHANKADNGNGGLKWIQKGGGYYSACTRHLKTA